jgi:hypothetical protein
MSDGERRNESGIKKNEAGKSVKELKVGIERKQKWGQQ